MQQTLLIQIFRREPLPTPHTHPNQPQAEGADCPTCLAFSPHCCQGVEGLQVFNELQQANSIHLWNIPFMKAVIGLKYQVGEQQICRN